MLDFNPSFFCSVVACNTIDGLVCCKDGTQCQTVEGSYSTCCTNGEGFCELTPSVVLVHGRTLAVGMPACVSLPCNVALLVLIRISLVCSSTL